MARAGTFGILALLFGLAQTHLLASFNIQVFGDKKMEKPHVVDNLVEILRRYDFTCIQEIRDADGDSFEKLVRLLNTKGGSKQYESIVGDRLGKSTSKEQYGIIYKTKDFQLANARTYPGYATNFERPPLQVTVRPKFGGVPTFQLLVVHLDPQEVVNEMESLYRIAEEIRKSGHDNIMIIGDMNAGCGYLSKRRKRTLSFVKDTGYTWYIGDDVDTTVGQNNCPYDRIIVHGDSLKRALVNDSAKAYRFSEAMGLTMKQAAEISDHYPIEIRMKSLKGKSCTVETNEF